MKQVFNHIRGKEPHERRRHALQFAGVLTGAFALLWVGSFAARMGGPVAAAEQNQGDPTQTAAAYTAVPGGNSLEVASSSVYSY